VWKATESLYNGTPPPSDGNQGIIAVGILEAMYQSAKNRREIAFERVLST
jgi:hypothetical protein